MRRSTPSISLARVFNLNHRQVSTVGKFLSRDDFLAASTLSHHWSHITKLAALHCNNAPYRQPRSLVHCAMPSLQFTLEKLAHYSSQIPFTPGAMASNLSAFCRSLANPRPACRVVELASLGLLKPSMMNGRSGSFESSTIRFVVVVSSHQPSPMERLCHSHAKRLPLF